MPPTPSSRSRAQKSPLDHAWPWVVRAAGLLIALWETMAETVDRPSLLVLAAVMIGLPEFIRFERELRR